MKKLLFIYILLVGLCSCDDNMDEYSGRISVTRVFKGDLEATPIELQQSDTLKYIDGYYLEDSDTLKLVIELTSPEAGITKFKCFTPGFKIDTLLNPSLTIDEAGNFSNTKRHSIIMNANIALDVLNDQESNVKTIDFICETGNGKTSNESFEIFYYKKQNFEHIDNYSMFMNYSQKNSFSIVSNEVFLNTDLVGKEADIDFIIHKSLFFISPDHSDLATYDYFPYSSVDITKLKSTRFKQANSIVFNNIMDKDIYDFNMDDSANSIKPSSGSIVAFETNNNIKGFIYVKYAYSTYCMFEIKYLMNK